MKKNEELITIVVPVYKVEQYLNRCIDSIINQTYKNLEVILVDDGSPDNCGKICDEYAKKDKRIKVIHKENEGVSEARNIGIKLSSGKYITFIDSDDYISEDYIYYLYNNLKDKKSDISSCWYMKFENEITPKKEQEELFEFDTIETLENLYYQKYILTCPWGKLFKRNLFDNIDFPYGVNRGEDLGTIYKVIFKSNKIVISNLKKYYYFQRENSLMKSNFNITKMKSLEYAKEILKFSNNNTPQIVLAARNRLFMEAIFIAIQVPKKIYKQEQKKLFNIIKENRKFVLFDKKSKYSYRFIALLSYFGIKPIKLLFILKNKIGG